jgi:hypothetical protein
LAGFGLLGYNFPDIHFFSWYCLPSEEGIFTLASAVMARLYLPSFSIFFLYALIKRVDHPKLVWALQ